MNEQTALRGGLPFGSLASVPVRMKSCETQSQTAFLANFRVVPVAVIGSEEELRAPRELHSNHKPTTTAPKLSIWVASNLPVPLSRERSLEFYRGEGEVRPPDIRQIVDHRLVGSKGEDLAIAGVVVGHNSVPVRVH